MSGNLGTELKNLIDYFIKNNVIAKKVKALNVKKEDKSYDSSFSTFGHTFGNNDFSEDLDRRISKLKNTQTIGEYLESLYQEKRKEDPQVLRRGGITRDYKSKVVNGVIQPSKEKLLCFAIAFELNLEGTERLLNKAGYTLAEENSVFDSIMGYFIEKGYYFGAEIDICLEEYGQPTLFSIV